MTWNLEPPPGFQGLHPCKPLSVYHRHLPHWRQAGATYFVTFRLADSLPQERLTEMQLFREEWYQRNPPPHTQEHLEELWDASFGHLDEWLDAGAGSCCLRDVQARRVVTSALHHFQGSRYELGCYVNMPNHVHLIVRPFDEDSEALSRITHSWKRFTSRQINKLHGLDGRLWQDESYDRVVRDAEHLWRTVQYIGRNPRKAGVDGGSCSIWINESWSSLGWCYQE